MAAATCPDRPRSCSSRPSRPAKRAAEWGPDGLQERLATAWTAFLARIDDADHPWMTVVIGHGRDAVEQTYVRFLDGTVPANEGHILSV